MLSKILPLGGFYKMHNSSQFKRVSEFLYTDSKTLEELLGVKLICVSFY